MHQADESYNNTIVYDKSRKLSFKKIYAEFIVYKLGKLEQLIPKTKDYECCFSNFSVFTQTYFIKDVLNLVIL